MDNFIEKNKKYWGPEFAKFLCIEHRPEHDILVAMGCYTMLYEIADSFQDGKYRDEILTLYGVK